MSDYKRYELQKKFRNYVKEMEGEKAFRNLSGSKLESLCVNFILTQANEDNKEQEKALNKHIVRHF